MVSREPAGDEGERGKSAESSARARAGGGAVENICGTVRGVCRGGAICLQGFRAFLRERLSVEACLYRLFVLLPAGRRSAK